MDTVTALIGVAFKSVRTRSNVFNAFEERRTLNWTAVRFMKSPVRTAVQNRTSASLYINVLDKLLTPTSVGTTTLIMSWSSKATLVLSFMTRADSKLEVKKNSRR
jgi:hypothetical protein